MYNGSAWREPTAAFQKSGPERLAPDSETFGAFDGLSRGREEPRLQDSRSSYYYYYYYDDDDDDDDDDYCYYYYYYYFEMLSLESARRDRIREAEPQSLSNSLEMSPSSDET